MYFVSEGVAKDKNSVWDIETWPCVISNLDLDPFVVWILGQNLNHTPLIVFPFFSFYYIFYIYITLILPRSPFRVFNLPGEKF